MNLSAVGDRHFRPVSRDFPTIVCPIVGLGLIPTPGVYPDLLTSASANISSSISLSTWFARSMILSVNIMNNIRYCDTPHVISMQSVSSSLVLTTGGDNRRCLHGGRWLADIHP